MPHAIIGFYENVEKFHEELAPDRYRNILGAKETYMLAVDLEEKINLLIDNHHEFEVELLKLAEANRTWPKTEAMDAMQKRLLLDRRIVNLLSACRLYLDQSSHAKAQSSPPPMSDDISFTTPTSAIGSWKHCAITFNIGVCWSTILFTSITAYRAIRASIWSSGQSRYLSSRI